MFRNLNVYKMLIIKNKCLPNYEEKHQVNVITYKYGSIFFFNIFLGIFKWIRYSLVFSL